MLHTKPTSKKSTLKSATSKHSTKSPLKTQQRQIHNPLSARKDSHRRLKFTQLRDSLLDGTYEQRKSPSTIKREFFETREDFGPPQLIGATPLQQQPQQTWVFNLQKERVGITQLSPSTFSAPTHRTDLIHQAVRWQLAKRRAGTHKGLNRREISGTGKKPFAQKGGGRARASTLVSPIHIGGARAHPKKIRDYSFDMPRQLRRQALRTALSARVKDGRFYIVDSLAVPTHKTKDVENILSNWHTQKALLVHGNYEQDANLILGLRNSPHYNLLPARGANVHDILRAPIIMMSLQALADLETHLSPERDHRRTAQIVSPILGLKSINQTLKEFKAKEASV